MKIVDLFGNTIETIEPNKRKREKTLFDDYEGFVEKFEAKKTTDDCYTPENIYATVLEWVSENCDIEGARIVRPFYTGGDYEMEDYQPNDVVVDNPPFSILTQIVKFYQNKGIPFFLFAPHLTVFGPGKYCTSIVTDASITYANKAVVATSFVSNMFGDTAIICAGDLCGRLKEANKKNSTAANLPSYIYPDNVVSACTIGYKASRGINFRINSSEAVYCPALDAMRTHKKSIFGGGYLIGESAAQRVAQAREQAREQDEKNTIVWQLSEREKEIIRKLG